MKLKPIQCALLLTFALWASGLAQFAHERFEHSHGDPAPLVKLPAGCQRVPIKKQSLPSHDDCAVCFMLGMMKAEQSAPPMIAPAMRLTPEIIVVQHFSAETRPARSFLPIRGPPAV